MRGKPQITQIPQMIAVKEVGVERCKGSSQFKLKLVATVSGLQDDPKRIGRGSGAVPCRHRLRQRNSPAAPEKSAAFWREELRSS